MTASSMLTGERRWNSTRRSGLTVLGKVAVPKPINLPSQRLENHGLDPNVEIVPKGTSSWGGRSSSSTSNAWGLSTLSPTADGGAGSPNHLNGRPSSSGSVTRPSTAGSDKFHEPIANAWVSNSRPSSASGPLSSSQSSLTSLRPHSAETRPGSSHLSRFAEPLSDNSVTWSSSGTAENSGTKSSKNDGFSLTSGNFPTLGSEKETSKRIRESEDHRSHSRPSSSSGVAVSGKEGTENFMGGELINENAKKEITNTWRGLDEVRPNVENWDADPQSFPNSGLPAHHYDAWRGPPVNSHPGGVWYGAPPGGPPFGSQVPPRGFPMDPFPYYCPQMPPPALVNHQPVHPSMTGPRGPHSKNGEMYRPHLHDSHIRPDMPLRQGFFPRPVPYESYYVPPMGHYNPNDRDVPHIGREGAPAAYSRYTRQNAPDHGSSRGRSSGYSPRNEVLISEQVESRHPQDAQESYRVLLKHQDTWDAKDEEQKYPRKSSSNMAWSIDHDKNDDRERRMAIGKEASNAVIDNRRAATMMSYERECKLESSVGVSANRLQSQADYESLAFSEVSSKDTSLIKKIEVLNAKSQTYNRQYDLKHTSSREERKYKLHDGCAKIDLTANEAATETVSNDYIDVESHEHYIPDGHKGPLSTVGNAAIRSSSRSMHGRADHRGKGKFNSHETDDWHKKSQVKDSFSAGVSVNNESSYIRFDHHLPHSGAREKPEVYPQGKDEGLMSPISDPDETQEQRAKMIELAKQRIKQREKEEEAWARDQKAKAFAKLEELNRRTQARDGSSQKLETGSNSAMQNVSEVLINPMVPNLVFGSNPYAVMQSSERSANRIEKSSNFSNEVLLEKSRSSFKESILEHDKSQSFVIDGNKAEACGSKSSTASSALGSNENASVQTGDDNSQVDKLTGVAYEELPVMQKITHKHQTEPLQRVIASTDHDTPQAHESNMSRHKRGSYRQKRSGFSEKLASSSLTEESKHRTEVVNKPSDSLEVVAGVVVSKCEQSASERFLHQRRKNRSAKSKHKLEEMPSSVTSPSVVSNYSTASDTVTESGKPEVKPENSESILDTSPRQSHVEAIDPNPLSDRMLLLNEEDRIRSNNQFKSHQSHRMPRNTQAPKSADKFHGTDAVVWAPVQSQDKTKILDEVTKSTVEVSNPSIKGDQQVHNNLKNKRAEMARYIPKPVAKEMAQQGNSNQSAGESNNLSHDTVGRPEHGALVSESSQNSRTGNTESAVVSSNVDSRQNKSVKSLGSRLQRMPAESTSSFTSNDQKNVHKSVEPQMQKPNVISVEKQPRDFYDQCASDGWNDQENPSGSAPVTVGKDQSMPSRGKRHSHKGLKGAGYHYNFVEKRTTSGDGRKDYVWSSASDAYQGDIPAALKENCGVGEIPSSHWQPKSRQSISGSQQASRPGSSHGVGSEVSKVNKVDQSVLQSGVSPPQPDTDTALASVQRQHYQSCSGKSDNEEVSSGGHHGDKRERKISHKSCPEDRADSSPLEDFHASSGFHKKGNQSNRFGRDYESHGEWEPRKEDKRNNIPGNYRERRRQKSHYEYQPVGQQSSKKASK